MAGRSTFVDHDDVMQRASQLSIVQRDVFHVQESRAGSVMGVASVQVSKRERDDWMTGSGVLACLERRTRTKLARTCVARGTVESTGAYDSYHMAD